MLDAFLVECFDYRLFTFRGIDRKFDHTAIRIHSVWREEIRTLIGGIVHLNGSILHRHSYRNTPRKDGLPFLAAAEKLHTLEICLNFGVGGGVDVNRPPRRGAESFFGL